MGNEERKEGLEESPERVYEREFQKGMEMEQKFWKEWILKDTVQNVPLKILDLGCGLGFLSIPLAMEGHDVTGIESSKSMLEKARKHAAQSKAEVEFLYMDVHQLDFEDNSFDLLISRNVIWTEFEPERTYREWKRVIKPKGQILILDGFWYLKLFEGRGKEGPGYIKIYGSDMEENGFGSDTYKEQDIAFRKNERPFWDHLQLWKLGFEEIVTREIRDHFPEEASKDNTVPYVPQFMVSGMKQAGEKVFDKWENPLFFDGLEDWEEIRFLTMVLNRDEERFYEQNIRLKLSLKQADILDIGCGAGGNSFYLTRDGYSVTGIDSSEELIGEALKISERIGLFPTFEIADTEELPFAEDSFDIVLVCRMEGEEFDREKAEEEWKRVLKPKGTILIIE